MRVIAFATRRSHAPAMPDDWFATIWIVRASPACAIASPDPSARTGAVSASRRWQRCIGSAPFLVSPALGDERVSDQASRDDRI